MSIAFVIVNSLVISIGIYRIATDAISYKRYMKRAKSVAKGRSLWFKYNSAKIVYGKQYE